MTPDQYTNQEFLLDVGNGHQIYVWDWGNKGAKTPFIAFHGGPGGGTRDRHRAAFDPAKHRVIFFDQRGCGQSLPAGLLEHNTTDDLLEDATKILDHLKITEVRTTGSSWGSALALAYAIRNPERVTAVVASAIFLGTKAENEWVDNGHYRPFYPEVWERYLARTPAAHHSNPTPYHFKQILSATDPDQVLDSAIAVEEMEHSLMALDDRGHPINRETFDPTPARVYAHYMSQACFLPEQYILKNAHKLTMPVWLVQGRYDIACPPHTAYALHKAIPRSKLFITISNHRAEHENWNVLRSILTQFEEA